MPIQPLDIQVMFSRLNQVGKEHADQAEMTHVEQSLQGSSIVRSTEQQARTVNESRDLGRGIEKSKEDGKRKDEKKEKGRTQASGEEETDKEIITDPDLGKHIDLTG